MKMQVIHSLLRGFLFLAFIFAVFAVEKEVERESRQNILADGNYIYLGDKGSQIGGGDTALDNEDSFNPLTGFQPQDSDGPLILAPQNPTGLNSFQTNTALNNFAMPGGLANPFLQFPNLAFNNNPSQNSPGINNFLLNNFQNNGMGNNPSANSGINGQGLFASLGNSGVNLNPRLLSGINNPGFGPNNNQGLQGISNNHGLPGFANNPTLAPNQGISNLLAGNLLGGLPNIAALNGLQGVRGNIGSGGINNINGFPRAGNFFNSNSFPLTNGFLGANGFMGNIRPQGPNNLNSDSEKLPQPYSSLNPFSEENKENPDESLASALISNRVPNSSNESSGRSNS